MSEDQELPMVFGRIKNRHAEALYNAGIRTESQLVALSPYEMRNRLKLNISLCACKRIAYEVATALCKCYVPDPEIMTIGERVCYMNGFADGLGNDTSHKKELERQTALEGQVASLIRLLGRYDDRVERTTAADNGTKTPAAENTGADPGPRVQEASARCG